ncbi:MAG: ABC transporter permease [Desulfamplus sp.]|nr:ABC transporter permease [Desulfamplus sp.]
MKLNTIIWKELFLRKSQLVSALLAVTLGIAVIVGIQTVAAVSEKAVKIKMENLGANILVLPQSASVDDYYAADIDAPTFPEAYVERILNSALTGVDNLSPKLTRRIDTGSTNVVLTGILPSGELAAKPYWTISGLSGEDTGHIHTGSSGKYADPRLQRTAIETLNRDDVLVGKVTAERLNLTEGGTLTLRDHVFTVVGILPETGTVDDNRVFAHLHTVQGMLGIGSQISCIEIMGCCSAISDGLLGNLRNILPDTRITTIGQIVSTQIETNRLMEKVSLIFLVIILIVGAISIGNFMWANVEERRREIGTMIAIGATQGIIYRLFMTKALVLGAAGGFFGYIIGTAGAMILGPRLAGLAVAPMAVYLLYAILMAVLISLAGSFIPTFRASRLDPNLIMQEI